MAVVFDPKLLPGLAGVDCDVPKVKAGSFVGEGCGALKFIEELGAESGVGPPKENALLADSCDDFDAPKALFCGFEPKC